MQRSAAVTSRRLALWTHACDLGWGRRPKLHGMQALMGLLYTLLIIIGTFDHSALLRCHLGTQWLKTSENNTTQPA